MMPIEEPSISAEVQADNSVRLDGQVDCQVGRIPAVVALQIGHARTEIVGSVSQARECFERYGALHLGNIFQPAFLNSLLGMCESSQWQPEPEVAGFREVESPQRAGRVVNLVLSRPEVLRWIERVSGCRELLHIEGRVTRILNRPGDQLRWHDDNVFSDRRQLQIVINLGVAPFEGGEFLMRPKGGELLFAHSHKEPGSALLFKVDAKLEHCVLPLKSGGPRRVYAGCLVPASPF